MQWLVSPVFMIFSVMEIYCIALRNLWKLSNSFQDKFHLSIEIDFPKGLQTYFDCVWSISDISVESKVFENHAGNFQDGNKLPQCLVSFISCVITFRNILKQCFGEYLRSHAKNKFNKLILPALTASMNAAVSRQNCRRCN